MKLIVTDKEYPKLFAKNFLKTVGYVVVAGLFGLLVVLLMGALIQYSVENCKEAIFILIGFFTLGYFFVVAHLLTIKKIRARPALRSPEPTIDETEPF